MESALGPWREATAPLEREVDDDGAAMLLLSSCKPPSTAQTLSKTSTQTADRSCYQPMRYDHFVQRMDTFSIATWFAKPINIGVLNAARHGWINTDIDQLYCAYCKCFLMCTIDDDLSIEGRKSVAKRYEEKLETGHLEDCPWRRSPSPLSFIRLPMATMSQTLTALKKSLSTLYQSISLNYTTQQALSSVELSSSCFSQIQGELQIQTDDIAATLSHHAQELLKKDSDQLSLNDDFSMKLMVLAVCGWKKDANTPCLLTCDWCHRRLYLKASNNRSQADNEPTQKKQKQQSEKLGAITSHRYYCPMIVAITSTDDKDADEFFKLPGWKRNARSLSTKNAAKSSVGSKAPKEAYDTVMAMLNFS